MLWEERRILYEQCMDLELFYRDTEQADQWMIKQNAFLENNDLGDSLDAVESLLKKHDNFEKSLAAHEEKIKALDEFARKLVESGHYASEDIETRRQAFLEKRKHLMDRSNARRSLLNDAFNYQQFTIDYDDAKFWIVEKLKISLDENFSDLTNLTEKVAQHENFQKEISANKDRIEEITAKGNELVQDKHYAMEDIESKTNDINTLWKQLANAIENKKSKLSDATQEQAYNRSVEDIEFWLNEVEQQIAIEDYGKDLNSVNNLLKRQGIIESELVNQQNNVNKILSQSNLFNENQHFHKNNINAKKAALLKRFNSIKVSLGKSKNNKSILLTI